MHQFIPLLELHCVCYHCDRPWMKFWATNQRSVRQSWWTASPVFKCVQRPAPTMNNLRRQPRPVVAAGAANDLHRMSHRLQSDIVKIWSLNDRHMSSLWRWWGNLLTKSDNNFPHHLHKLPFCSRWLLAKLHCICAVYEYINAVVSNSACDKTICSVVDCSWKFTLM